MSDLTKALMGYKETPFGFVNPDAVSENSHIVRKECPYSLEKFTVDTVNGVVIIPTPRGNQYHDESLGIDFDQFLPHLGLGVCSLRKDDGSESFSLTTHILYTASIGKSFARDSVPYVATNGVVLTIEQWQQLLDSFVEQYAKAESSLYLPVDIINAVAKIFSDNVGYELHVSNLYTRKTYVEDIPLFNKFYLNGSGLLDVISLYRKQGGDIHSTDFHKFLEFVLSGETLSGFYLKAIITAWFSKTNVEHENAKLEALQERKELVRGIVSVANSFHLRNGELELAYKIFKMVNNHFYKTCSERFTEQQRALIANKKVYEIRNLLSEHGY